MAPAQKPAGNTMRLKIEISNKVMTGENKKERAALNRLADALVDDILNTSDEDILTEFKETHGDHAQNAAAMRTLFEKTVIAMNKQRP